jgi:DNA-binding response OmpR family regulator
MDGVTLVRKLYKIDPDAVVVVVTGRVTEEAVRGALTAGAKMVLRKPFEISDLRTIVHSIQTDPSGELLAEIGRARDMVAT